MENIKILDCTLRDGGYVNDWNFGNRSIKKIIEKLSQSHVDIIECGFLRDVPFDENRSLYDDVKKLHPFLGKKNKDTIYVGMIDQPYIPLKKIVKCDGSSIDGIRLTFHDTEKEIREALEYGKELMNKGYKVFIQPVGITSYSDEGLLNLITKVNKLRPYAFYIVDTLGIMYKNDLFRLFHLIDRNLEPSIHIGFHSHNNLQLSFSNAQELLILKTKRNIIIDSTVFGMGRGAGNLCTELITHYINESTEEKYNTIPLLEIVDEHLSRFFHEPQWGYTVPYYLAAINKCHPNYASFLINKQTITVKQIHSILKQLPIEKRDIFDKKYIEDLYISYQEKYVDDSENLECLRNLLDGRDILVLSPGKSLAREKDTVRNFIKLKNPFVISVNFLPEDINVDAVFISNLKRFEQWKETLENSPETTLYILTSNLLTLKKQSSIIVNYSNLLISSVTISDNAGMMLLNLLNSLSITTIFLAGFDGFSVDKTENYIHDELINNVEKEALLNKNEAISNYISSLRKDMEIHFLTSTIYDSERMKLSIYL
ncbi:aldolase catalytic domain-containing protein [Caldibacillus lycopersici]|uniref:Aldolase catalytic domain-containing protein n=1 Tax=Perspicuibacillus lycopersici TaxID=1325689 RepID=A0AAE3IUI3_9BACI|nr:aldolase catalytic domain-containing protein [Perspicuibacillus lycopersici]MCU9612315.1 aldolase catalytic domain-containing protein [Perspicuibacillus lycopersici]